MFNLTIAEENYLKYILQLSEINPKTPVKQMI